VDKNGYSEQNLTEISAELRNMPTLGVTFSKTRAIAFLKNDIFGLREKGYTWAQVIDILKEKGIEVSRNTLANYLYKDDGKKKRRSPSRRVFGKTVEHEGQDTQTAPKKTKGKVAISSDGDTELDKALGKLNTIKSNDDVMDI
jgi:hypothetical protein